MPKETRIEMRTTKSSIQHLFPFLSVTYNLKVDLHHPRKHEDFQRLQQMVSSLVDFRRSHITTLFVGFLGRFLGRFLSAWFLGLRCLGRFLRRFLNAGYLRVRFLRRFLNAGFLGGGFMGGMMWRDGRVRWPTWQSREWPNC
jgi:hypothetical protein